jgi:hypothetical protein
MLPVKKPGALAAAQQDPQTPDGSPEHEQAESPQFEQQEQTQGDDDEAGEDQQEEAGESPDQEQAEEGQEGGDLDEGQQKQIFDLCVGRVLDALAKDGQALDVALKADPVHATVQYGTAAVRAIAQSASALP